MGILPMSITGVPPVSLLLPLPLLPYRRNKKKQKTKTMGKMPMGLMAKMAMLRTRIFRLRNQRHDRP
jgi:hypothetical protein